MIAGALAVTSFAGDAGSGQYSLFTDHRTLHVDDLLTVIVDEQNAATDNANTKTRSESKGHVDSRKGKGVAKPVPSAKADADLEAKFDGNGKTERNGNVTAVVSARVAEVLANGYLVVEGSKQVVINDETETLKVSGVVRPEDIAADNSVRSSRMADVHISYAGDGSVGSAQQKGVVARLMDWLF